MAKQTKTAAVLTIHRASDMTPRGRKMIADWLRQQAKAVLKHGSDLSSRFTARYRY